MEIEFVDNSKSRKSRKKIIDKYIPYKTGDTRYFSKIYPVMFLSKDPKKYPNAIQIYPIQNNQRHKTRYVYEALSDYNWKKGDIILLSPSLCFGTKKIN